MRPGRGGAGVKISGAGRGKMLARVIFLIPAASSKSERVFSVTGRVVTLDRNRLAPEMVEDLVTLKCNLRLLRELPSI